MEDLLSRFLMKELVLSTVRTCLNHPLDFTKLELAFGGPVLVSTADSQLPLCSNVSTSYRGTVTKVSLNYSTY